MKNRVGKPKQYSIDQLDCLLLKYVENNPSATITYIDLERATGVGRNTWSRNMKEKIENLNRPPSILEKGNESSLPLPNMDELVKNNIGNQQKLIQALNQVNSIIQKLYVKAKSVHIFEQEIEDLNNKIIKINEELIVEKNKLLREQVEHFSQAYRNIAVTSSYPDSELKNVFDFKKGDKKNKDKIMTDLIEQFDMFGPK
ncbi:hypothetical protein JDW19_05835 [Paenibacillus polymyxa]|uniref:Uncharacterized protein n=2 Tax=Paenibacillus polymyxa TaxID=1406 RepID=A0A8I1IQ74_PAEPO|nr:MULTISPECIES: hypothetical protein [unclassified Paenibacillus]KAF6569471.1 hypothetical protein G9G53_21855 [Paenibacillus sp. EKM206P]MBM0632647.1 hypothetical protein [Paenibacillus polymyxa]